MGTNCAPLLADLFLHSYHTFRYIDDVLSINNHNFHNYVHLIYPDELDIKDTTESDKSASLEFVIAFWIVITLTLQSSTFPSM